LQEQLVIFLCVSYKVKNVIDRIFKTTLYKDSKRLCSSQYSYSNSHSHLHSFSDSHLSIVSDDEPNATAQNLCPFSFHFMTKTHKIRKKITWKWVKRMRFPSSSYSLFLIYFLLSVWVCVCVCMCQYVHKCLFAYYMKIPLNTYCGASHFSKAILYRWRENKIIRASHIKK